MLVNSTAMPPTLCVVIPSRDRVGTVGDAIKSVLRTRRNDVQVVVVDDGSRDETFARLAEIRDPRLVSCRVKPGGANRARNIGAGLSEAPLIAFLDSDDMFTPSRIDRLIGFFAAHPSVDCLIDGFVDVSPRRTRVHRMPQITPSAADIRRLLLAHRLPLTNSAITVRRRAWDAVAGHDEDLQLHDDRDFLLRLATSHQLCLGQATDVIKRRGPDSVSHRATGYIAGLDALAARYPDYHRPEYSTLFRYLVVRGIMTSLSRGHFLAAFQEFRALRAASHLPQDFLASISCYWSGRRRRMTPVPSTDRKPAEVFNASAWLEAVGE